MGEGKICTEPQIKDCTDDANAELLPLPTDWFNKVREKILPKTKCSKCGRPVEQDINYIFCTGCWHQPNHCTCKPLKEAVGK